VAAAAEPTNILGFVVEWIAILMVTINGWLLAATFAHSKNKAENSTLLTC
jgi:hypothetical protein